MAGAAGRRGMDAVMRAIMSLQTPGGLLTSAVKSGSHSQSRAHIQSLMRVYIDRLNLDLRTLPPVIHIAGTKGKGSTAAMCESILRASGLRTGLFTSPHLVDVRERIRLDGKPVPEPIFLEHFWATWDALQSAHVRAQTDATLPAPSEPIGAGSMPADTPSEIASLPVCPPFFHFLTLVALRLFSVEALDVCVLEVGIGGRLDATNIIPAPAVCGITTLDFDHMEMLGETLPEIASEKAGIMKRGAPCVSVLQRPDALAKIAECAAAAGAHLFSVDVPSVIARCKDGRFPALGLDGDFQRVNAALAIALTDIYMYRRACTLKGQPEDDSFGSTTPPKPGACPPPTYTRADDVAPATREGLLKARWSGRAHRVEVDARTGKLARAPLPSDAPSVSYFIDGAHTEKSVQEATRWYCRRTDTGAKRILVFYCGHDKDALQLLLPLSTVAFDEVFITGVPFSRPSLVEMPTTDEALAAFLGRKKKMGDDRGVEEVLASAARAGIVPETLFGAAHRAGTDAAGVRARGWPGTLEQLWHAVHERPEFALTRERMHAEMNEGLVDAPALPSVAPKTTVLESIPQVLDKICASARESPQLPHQVLITGSLYLVGGTFGAVGWTEDVAASGSMPV